LKDLWQGWMERRYPLFRQLAAAVYGELAASPDTIAFDWYARLAKASHELPAAC
jgi:hypothetical protein